jgi:RNA polymerase sigma-70 factor (ECF subfamily)
MQINLWNRIRNGDSSAMKSLYQTSYQELFAYGFKLIADREKIKDAIHELFCEFWEKHERLPVVLQLMPYVKICLRNKLLKQIKHDAVLLTLPETFETEETIQLSYETLLIASQENAEKKRQIEIGISKLTKTQKEVLQLRFYDGNSYEQIAQVLDLKVRTVYNHIHNAISILRDQLSSTS